MLKAMCRARKAAEHRDQFARVRFVYLHKPKDRLARHLERTTAAGDRRPIDSQTYTIACYERFHAMYRDLADHTVDCATKGVADVVADIRGLLEAGR